MHNRKGGLEADACSQRRRCRRTSFSLFFCAMLAAVLARALQSNARQRAVDVGFYGLLKVS